MVSPTATRNDDRFGHDGPFCRLCPELKDTATATPSAGSKGDDRFGCDDRGRGHVIDPRVIPLPTINHDGLKSPDSGHSVNGDDTSGDNGSGDNTSGHNDDGSGHD